MPKRMTITCPKDNDKRYFSYKRQTYHADINVYINDALLLSHINDAEEYLPLEYVKDLYIDDTRDNSIKFEYNLSFGPVTEKVDVIHDLKTNNVCSTTIHRHNFVEGSENLTDDYLVTFSINNQKTFLNKDWYEEDTKVIKFDSHYTYPLDIRWFSKKPFVNSSDVYWDDIQFRMEEI